MTQGGNWVGLVEDRGRDPSGRARARIGDQPPGNTAVGERCAQLACGGRDQVALGRGQQGGSVDVARSCAAPEPTPKIAGHPADQDTTIALEIQRREHGPHAGMAALCLALQVTSHLSAQQLTRRPMGFALLAGKQDERGARDVAVSAQSNRETQRTCVL